MLSLAMLAVGLLLGSFIGEDRDEAPLCAIRLLSVAALLVCFGVFLARHVL